jgi:solute carrier family 44 (choline transporter-like protein), member 1
MLCCFFTILIESAGILTKDEFGNVAYVKNGAMIFTSWCNLLAFVWFTQFLFGCQHMIVAGAVGKWFFTR